MGNPLKTYQGTAPKKDRKLSVLVLATGNRNPRKLTHHYRHSKDGFNWGYDQHGPSELARSLLLDAFGVEECPSSPDKCKCDSGWVEPTYHAFKSDVITKMARDEDWHLDQVTVCEWVFDYMKSDGLTDLATGFLEGSPR